MKLKPGSVSNARKRPATSARQHVTSFLGRRCPQSSLPSCSGQDSSAPRAARWSGWAARRSRSTHRCPPPRPRSVTCMSRGRCPSPARLALCRRRARVRHEEGVWGRGGRAFHPPCPLLDQGGVQTPAKGVCSWRGGVPQKSQIFSSGAWLHEAMLFDKFLPKKHFRPILLQRKFDSTLRARPKMSTQTLPCF